MRIAINTRFLLPGRLEGIGWYTWEVVRRLVENHPDDEFLFLFDRPFAPEFIPPGRVTAHQVFPPARHPLLWWWWFEMSLPRVLKAWGAEVFFSPDGYGSLRSGVPTVLVTHDLAFNHFPAQVPPLVRHYYQYFTPRYLERAQRVLTVSEYVRGDILQTYPVIPPTKITVAPNGVREGFVPLAAAEQTAIRQQYAGGDPYFFYVGAMHPRKNVERLIAAFDLFRRRTGANVRLLLGGRLAWQTGSLREAYENAEYREAITFLGYLPESELPKVLGSALALTYVSMEEGFGVPVLEALHTETPVITSNRSSLPEVAGEAALLVDPTDPEAIAAALQQLWEQPGLREELVVKGRQQRERFHWAATAEIVYAQLRLAAF
ncbi:MAG: glycosyltransferase family 4 protein [Lewinellaceae bacterium]|nr:glycosyltransferase family 4 protein [Lewinellaceae bacterium]